MGLFFAEMQQNVQDCKEIEKKWQISWEKNVKKVEMRWHGNCSNL